LRFFLVSVLGWLLCCPGASAQEFHPPSSWSAVSLQALLLGAAPLALALLIFGAWFARRIWISKSRNAPFPKLGHGSRPLLWAGLVLLLGFGLTTYRVQGVQQQLYTDAWLRFQQQGDRIEADLQSQFDKLLGPMRSIRGFVVARGIVSRSEFRDWVASRDIAQEFAGVRGFNMIDRVPRDQLAAYVAFQRRAGATGFAVRTTGAAPDLLVVRYSEPIASNRDAVGLDVGAELISRAAAERAMREGIAVMTHRITLEQDALKRPGLMYFLPVYRNAKIPSSEAERLRSFVGWVSAPIVLSDFMAHTIEGTQNQTSFSLYDGLDMNHATLMFDSDTSMAVMEVAGDGLRQTPALFSITRPLLIGGQLFQLRTRTTTGFEQSIDMNAPIRLAFSGSVLSVLASLVIWLLLAGRDRAEALARTMTQDIERLAMVARRTSNAVIISDVRQRIEWVNDGFTRITGYSAEDAVGRRVTDLLRSERTSLSALDAIRGAVASGETCRQLLLQRTKDGRECWVDLEIQPMRSAGGVITGFMSLESDVTEQVLAREALAREKDRADNILLGTNVGTWEWNVETGDFKVNERFSAMLGFAADEMLPGVWAFWERQVHPDDLVRSNNTMAMYLAGKTEQYSLDSRVKRKDGSWMWILSRGRAMTRSQDGKVEWMAGIHTDITDTKDNEQKLRDAQAFLDRAGRAAGIGAWQIDLKTKEVVWNDQTCEIHGEEFGFRPTLEQSLAYYPSQAQLQVRAAVASAVERGSNWDLTMPFSNAQGKSLWVRSVGEVEFDDSGAVRLLGALQDVTQVKEAQIKIERSENLLHAVLDSAVDVGVIATDLNNTITLFNKGAELLLGYQADELIGKRSSSLFFDVSQLAVIRESLALLLGRTPTEHEVLADVVGNNEQAEWTFVRKDGSRFTASLLISPMRDASGVLIGHLGIASDISLQKEYEDSLRNAMVRAEQSSVAKSQFVANMSHEIRTPMNAILGMLKLLHNTALSERQRDYADKTEGAARSLLGILNDILDFSKVEAGKMQLDPEPFLVEQLLADLSVILSANLGAKNLDLLFDIDPAIPASLVGDALRIKQILINLGGNAVKFTAHGQVVIQWRLLTRVDDVVSVEIAVRDSGIGIAPENQMRIFEGFSQAEASTTRRFGGTGLGLAISQRLIQLMGGNLSVASASGEGSVFSFTLDLPVAHLPQVDLPADKSVPVDEAGLQALLVDDNPVALAMGAAMMRSLGWKVTAADSGEQALALVRSRLESGETPFQAFFVDWQMPGLDGWQTLREVRRLYGDREAPVLVMLSGQGRELLAQRSQREVDLLNGFLVKPLTASMYKNALTQARVSPGAFVPESDEVVIRNKAQRLAGMRILVVEDNAINQQVAMELLSHEGAHITLADNGRLGVDAVANADPQFDVVLMDLQMPVMGGLDAARAIRVGLGLATLPVIAMTANAMASDREACLEAGMNDHVGKPFDLSHLVDTLVRHTRWVGAESVAAVIAPVTTAVAIVWPQGIDGAGALARMGGNTGLLVKTMRTFAQAARQLPEQLDVLAIAGDAADMRRELHALKGLAATLGVAELAALSARAEALLRQDASIACMASPMPELMADIASCIGTLLPVLESLATQLSLQITTEAPASPIANTDGVVLLGQLRELLGVLRNADMTAMELHATLRQSGGDALDDAMAPLDAAMAELEFELAAAECEILIDQLTQ